MTITEMYEQLKQLSELGVSLPACEKIQEILMPFVHIPNIIVNYDNDTCYVEVSQSLLQEIKSLQKADAVRKLRSEDSNLTLVTAVTIVKHIQANQMTKFQVKI